MNRPCTILVEWRPADARPQAKPKRVFISSDNLRDIDEFKAELEECGGSTEGLLEERINDPSFAGFLRRTFHLNHDQRSVRNGPTARNREKALVEWTKRDCLKWLKSSSDELGLNDLRNAKRAFRSNNVDGAILFEVDEQILQNIGISEEDARLLMVALLRLRAPRQRLRALPIARRGHLPGMQDPEVQEMVEALHNREALLHRFLSVDRLRSDSQLMNSVRIRLALARSVSPMTSEATPQLYDTPISEFHSALIVGPWYLEWNSSEMVIPKFMAGGRSECVFDLDTIPVQETDLNAIVNTLADCVVEWNTKWKFSMIPSLQDSRGNSQTFVDALLTRLNFAQDLPQRRSLNLMLARLREEGKTSLVFAPSHAFLERFDFARDEPYVFSSHRELDVFVARLMEACPDANMEFTREIVLLKAIDRSFWLAHLKNPEVGVFRPLESQGAQGGSQFATGCPFLDPRETMGF